MMSNIIRKEITFDMSKLPEFDIVHGKLTMKAYTNVPDPYMTVKLLLRKKENVHSFNEEGVFTAPVAGLYSGTTLIEEHSWIKAKTLKVKFLLQLLFSRLSRVKPGNYSGTVESAKYKKGVTEVTLKGVHDE